MPGYIIPPLVDVSNNSDEVESQVPNEVQEDPNDVTPESDVEEEREEVDEDDDGNVFTVLLD